MELAGTFSPQIYSQNLPCLRKRAWLAPESKDALDVSSEATLGLLLQLVLKGWEGHVVEGQVKEQRLARDGLESRWKVHKIGLLGDEGRVQAEGLKAFNQRLEVKSKVLIIEEPQWDFTTRWAPRSLLFHSHGHSFFPFPQSPASALPQPYTLGQSMTPGGYRSTEVQVKALQSCTTTTSSVFFPRTIQTPNQLPR